MVQILTHIKLAPNIIKNNSGYMDIWDMNLCSMSLAHEAEGYVFSFYNVRVTLNLHTFEQVKLFFTKQ